MSQFGLAEQQNYRGGRCGPKQKVKYRSEPEAQRRARVRMSKEPGLQLRPYFCYICAWWHLTKMKKGGA